jgi:hypothetical protein
MLGAIFILASIYFYFSLQRYLSVILLFALLTGCFQLVPIKFMVYPGIGITKTYDWVLLFTATIALIRPQLFWDVKVWRNFRALMLYGLFLIVILLYSIYLRDIEVTVSIRVFRSFIYFITLFLFIPLSLPDLEKVFRMIIYITSLAALVYCLQQFVNKELLNLVTSDEVGRNNNGILDRYYNLPVFIYPVIFFLFFSQNTFSIRYSWALLLCNCAAVLLSQHRNILLAVLVCYLLFLFFNKRLKFWNVMLYIFLGTGVILGTDYLWGNRFSRGIEDISQTTFNVSNINFYEVNPYELSTTEFRRLLVVERLNFILKDNLASLFGIGLITDDSYKTKKLNFNVGMMDEYGNVTQVASGDIVWSVLFLQLGIGGTLLFLLAHLSILRKFISNRVDPYMQVGGLYIVCLIITSFYSNTIELPYVTSLVMLFGAYYYNLLKRNNLGANHGNN